jgi:hypothetical protein
MAAASNTRRGFKGGMERVMLREIISQWAGDGGRVIDADVALPC